MWLQLEIGYLTALKDVIRVSLIQSYKFLHKKRELGQDTHSKQTTVREGDHLQAKKFLRIK
jgi:hypothetical protein